MEEAGIRDIALVGGKNASLGEMLGALTKKGIRVPSGFIITTRAYREFIREAGLEDLIRSNLAHLKRHDIHALEHASSVIREAIESAPLPKELEHQVAEAYASMEKQYGKHIDVAIRSSATAEDLPGASFAGQQDTYLGVRGRDHVFKAVRSCFGSLFIVFRVALYRTRDFIPPRQRLRPHGCRALGRHPADGAQ